MIGLIIWLAWAFSLPFLGGWWRKPVWMIPFSVLILVAGAAIAWSLSYLGKL